MKEERMIRVTKEQLENISEYFDSDVSIFDQIFEMFSCFDGEVTEYDYRLKRFDGLEPAPAEGLPAHMPLYETVLERGQHGVGTMSDEMSIQGGMRQ